MEPLVAGLLSIIGIGTIGYVVLRFYEHLSHRKHHKQKRVDAQSELLK